jgi:hypothetical protein
VQLLVANALQLSDLVTAPEAASLTQAEPPSWLFAPGLLTGLPPGFEASLDEEILAHVQRDARQALAVVGDRLYEQPPAASRVAACPANAGDIVCSFDTDTRAARCQPANRSAASPAAKVAQAANLRVHPAPAASSPAAARAAIAQCVAGRNRTVWLFGNSVTRELFFGLRAVLQGGADSDSGDGPGHGGGDGDAEARYLSSGAVSVADQKELCGAGGAAHGTRPGHEDCFGLCVCYYYPLMKGPADRSPSGGGGGGSGSGSRGGGRLAFVWQQRLFDPFVAAAIRGDDPSLFVAGAAAHAHACTPHTPHAPHHALIARITANHRLP